MKGVILAGGLGTRLYPLTKVTNKHLLPVYNKPMIYYPIETLVNAKIGEVLLVTGGNNAGEFLRLIGNGKALNLKHIEYTYQEGEGGIAQALSLAEEFADNGKICVVLGDNIIEKNIDRLKSLCEKHEVAELYVFGSVLKSPDINPHGHSLPSYFCPHIIQVSISASYFVPFILSMSTVVDIPSTRFIVSTDPPRPITMS